MNKFNSLPSEILSLNKISQVSDNPLGNEAISFTNLKDHYNKINGTAKRILSYMMDEDDYKITSLRVKDVTLSRHVTNTGYMPLRNVEVYKPSGFLGSASKFATLLSSLEPDVQQLNQALTQFEATLARFVHEPELMTKPVIALRSVKLPKGSKVLESFQDFFQGKQGIDTTTLNKLYGNMGELNYVSDTLFKLTEKFNGSDILTIKQRGDSLYKTLEYLEEELEANSITMSPKWRKAIGEQLYTLTEWLGIYSLFITKLVAFSVSHKDTVTKLNSL